KGELNFFIDSFLSIIYETLTDMRAELKEKVELLNNAVDKLSNDTRLHENKNIYEFMFILAQNHLFESNECFTIVELAEEIELLNNAVDKLSNDERLHENKNFYEFMFILAQNHFFDPNEGVTIGELAEEMDLSTATIRKIRNELLKKGLIKQEGIRPAYLSVNQEYFEQ